jgi:LysR family transcriptional regulator, hydrogen peroxide-inducible genes activator
MNLQQFEYVVAVTQSGNFSDAAEKCHISQSTLSTMIGRLENELGVRFFDRSTKPVTVTKEGQELIKQMRIINQEVGLLKEMVSSLKGEIKGTLNMGVIPTIAPYVLPGFLNDFAQKFPALQVSISEMTTQNIIRALKSRELDIGLLALPILDPDLRERPIYNEGFLLFDCTGISRGEVVNASDIDLDRFWLMEEGHCLSNQVIQICDIDLKRKKEGSNFHFRAGSIDSLIRFVKQNKGMTLLPELATLDMKTDENCRIIPFENPVPVRSVGLIYHKHFVKGALLELIQEAIIQNTQLKSQPSQKTKIYHPVNLEIR